MSTPAKGAEFTLPATFTISRHVNTVCRLCELRTEPDGITFSISGVFRHWYEIYCQDCYRELYRAAKGDIPGLPSPDFNTDDEFEFEVAIPEYLIKDREVLKLYKPADPIDIGLLKQRNIKRREERAHDQMS